MGGPAIGNRRGVEPRGVAATFGLRSAPAPAASALEIARRPA